MAAPVSFRGLIGLAPSTASTSDSALIIIDAQNEYAYGKLATAEVSSTRKAIASLLDKYRAAGAADRIVHVVHSVPAGAPVFTPDTDLAKEFDELAPRDGEKTVTKQFPGSFTGTDLGEFLEKTGVKKLVLTGYMAHVCVSTTARQGHEKGYDVLVAEDAVGDRDIPGADAALVKRVALAEIGDAFGTIVQSEAIA